MKKTQMHDTTLTIRLPKSLHLQFEQIAEAQFMKMGELIRQLMKEEIRKASPYINPVAQNEPQIIRKGRVVIGQPAITKPSQRIDWNDPDQVRQMKAMQEQREAQQKAKSEAYLNALRNGQTPDEEYDPWN